MGLWKFISDCVCMRCPDFISTFDWLFSRPRVGRLAGFAWLWCFFAFAVALDFFNNVLNTVTENDREAGSELAAAVAIIGFVVVTFGMAVQFTIMSTTRIRAKFQYESHLANSLTTPTTPRSDEAEMKDVSIV